MRLWGVTSISSSRYLCKFISFVRLFFFFFGNIYIYTHFFFQVLGESLHLTSEYLAYEAKVKFARSHVTTLEAENSKLAKEKVKTLIDELRTERQLTLEKDEQLATAREKIKGTIAKAVEGFQQTKEYNIVLFSWYFKGFKLLRRYFIKHPSGVDLEKLDVEEVDKEMAADEAAQSLATETAPTPTDTPKNAPATDDVAAYA